MMKFTTAIAVLVTSVALTACATHVSSDKAMEDTKMMDGKHAMKGDKMMKDAKMMDGEHAMKGDKMMNAKMMDGDHAMKDDSCHDHAANSMTNSDKHCHKTSQANHSHKYGG